jgi:membrane protease subunit HflK
MSWDWEKLKEQQQHHGKKTGGASPPPLDDILEKLKHTKFPGGPIIIILAVIGFILYTTMFQIETGEVGVIQRFGEFVRIEEPGLCFKLPLGIETVRKVNQEHLNTEEFDVSSEAINDRMRYTSEEDTSNVSLMLTGDLNVALVPWVVQYKIKDPYNWLFKVDDVKGLLRDMSEACMRLVIGDRSINEVIKREGIDAEVKDLLQKELDEAETGIRIEGIKLKKTNVPKPVQSSFNKVNQAVQEKERMIYQAREEYNKAIPAAKGKAERTIKMARGYALDRINRSEGDAQRFSALYKEYVKAKDVTKRRLYLETLKDLFPKLGPKYIIDENQKNILPLLNLGKQTSEVK